MTTPASDCRDLELLLSLQASGPGALAPDEALRLEAHLQGCAACRAESEAMAGVLAAAKLPPPSADEQARALRDLPGSLLETLHRRERRRGLARRALAGIAVAAAATLFVLAPAILQKDPAPAPAPAVAAAEAVWQEPDLDAIWEDTQVLDWTENAALAGGYDTESATVAALDY